MLSIAGRSVLLGREGRWHCSVLTKAGIGFVQDSKISWDCLSMLAINRVQVYGGCAQKDRLSKTSNSLH